MDLRVDSLTVEYTAGDYVLRPVDRLGFVATSGSLVVLLGPSGCGKTTLLSCLAGILTPTSGSVRFGDVDLTELTGSDVLAYRRRTVGVVFQAFNLVPSLTAAENVAAPLLGSGVPVRTARDRASKLLRQVGLGDRAAHRPGRLSGGQQQRVAIARALAHEPPLLLADEPTAHLDYVQVDVVLRLLRGLATPGRVVVVATHDERLLPLADLVVEMVPAAAGRAGGPTRIELHPGQLIFAQGSRGDQIYIVESGTVEILRTRPDGLDDLLATIRAGDHFGEMGPLFGLPRSATAQAGTKAVVAGYTVRQFSEMIGIERLGNLLGRAAAAPPPTRTTKTKTTKTTKTKTSPRWDSNPRPDAYKAPALPD